jgi:hypothetical protein
LKSSSTVSLTFRAIPFFHRTFATLAIPATLNRHVDSSLKNSTTYRCSPAENPPISPITIFRSHADYEFLDSTGDAWPPASAPGTAAPASNVSGVTRSAVSFQHTTGRQVWLLLPGGDVDYQ